MNQAVGRFDDTFYLLVGLIFTAEKKSEKIIKEKVAPSDRG